MDQQQLIAPPNVYCCSIMKRMRFRYISYSAAAAAVARIYYSKMFRVCVKRECTPVLQVERNRPKSKISIHGRCSPFPNRATPRSAIANSSLEYTIAWRRSVQHFAVTGVSPGTAAVAYTKGDKPHEHTKKFRLCPDFRPAPASILLLLWQRGSSPSSGASLAAVPLLRYAGRRSWIELDATYNPASAGKIRYCCATARGPLA